MQFIDVAEQYRRYQSEIDEALGAVLTSGRFVLGPEVAQLEDGLAARTGRAHCISCGSGTDALLMSLLAHGIGPGDEVITVPYTWISTAEVIELVHARTVFVDVDPSTFCIDPQAVEAAITERTRAIIPVSLFGQMYDAEAIQAIADRHGLLVIEDGAQSFGASRNGAASCGVPGTIGCTSFFPTKPLSCFGEGGAVFTDDDTLAERLRRIRTHGSVGRGDHQVVGLNGRLETVQAAVLLVKLAHFDEEIAARQQAAQRYAALLDGLVDLPGTDPGNTHVHAVYTVRSEQKEAIRAHMQEAGVPTAAYYEQPLHLEPVFAKLGYQAGDFPVSERLGQEGFCLPMHAFITTTEVEEVATAMRDAVAAVAGGGR